MAEGLREFGSRDKKEPNRSEHRCLAIDELLYLGPEYVHCTWKMQVVESALTANRHTGSQRKAGKRGDYDKPITQWQNVGFCPSEGRPRRGAEQSPSRATVTAAPTSWDGEPKPQREFQHPLGDKTPRRMDELNQVVNQGNW